MPVMNDERKPTFSLVIVLEFVTSGVMIMHPVLSPLLPNGSRPVVFSEGVFADEVHCRLGTPGSAFAREWTSLDRE